MEEEDLSSLEEEVPYFSKLGPTDRNSLISLRSSLVIHGDLNTGLKSLVNAIARIRTFVTSGTFDQSLRSIVCGLFWVNDFIGVNANQLKLLFKVSKTQINTHFTRMGTVQILDKDERLRIIIKALPLVADNASLQKNWTVWKFSPITPSPSMTGPDPSRFVPLTPQLNPQSFGIDGVGTLNIDDDPFPCFDESWFMDESDGQTL